MSTWILFSRRLDALSRWLGRQIGWLVLLAVLVSTGNAIARKSLDLGSNAALELQWYLFSAIFLLAAGYTLLNQEHVRIDAILGRFSRRTQVKVELFGIACFLWPFVVTVVALSLPVVVRAWSSGEMSGNAGGLIRWPAYALVPLGFVLLGLQGVSEFIKRLAFLRGLGEDPAARASEADAARELAQSIQAARQEAQP